MTGRPEVNKDADRLERAQGTLCSDSLATLTEHFQFARHQQEIRDRWFRYYLIIAGAIVSLVATILAALSGVTRGVSSQ
jgi:hypothetical protein